MKYLFLIFIFVSFSHSDYLFNGRCVINYSLYQGSYYAVHYSSNPTVLVNTNFNKYSTEISDDIYTFSYDENNIEQCTLSNYYLLGMTKENYNFVLALLGSLFGIFILILVIGAL